MNTSTPESLVMKYLGSILDFTNQRNAEIVRACRRELAKASFIVMPRIFQLVADSPSSRFWVSEERASIVIGRMIAGKPLPKMRPTKREMFEEIYRRFLIERKRYPDMSIYQLVSIIVNQPAPKFYLTPRTVAEFYSRIKNGYYEKYHSKRNPGNIG